MKIKLFVFVLVFAFNFTLAQNIVLKTPIADAVFSSNSLAIDFLWEDQLVSNWDIDISSDISFNSFNTFSSSQLNSSVPMASLNGVGVYYYRIRSSIDTSSTRTFYITSLANLGNLEYHINAQEAITTSAGKVSNWNNLANNNYNATQPISSFQPELDINLINGLNAVKFGGVIGITIHQMMLNSMIDITDTNFTIISCYKPLSFAPQSYILGNDQSPRNGFFIGGTGAVGSNLGMIWETSSFNYIFGDDDLEEFNWGVRSVKHNALYNNSNNNLAYNTLGQVEGLQFNLLGVRPDSPSNFLFHGYLGDVLVFNESLNDSSRLIAENYLKTKYTPFPNLGKDTMLCASSIQLSIPGNHGYSSVLWSTGETDVDSIIVTENGNYWVEVESFGITLSDSIHVSGLVPKPELSQLNDTILCLFDTLNVEITNSISSGVSLTWNDGTAGNDISVATNDTIYALASSGACTISSDTIVVDINNFPATQGLGQDRSICLNTNLLFDYGSASSGPYTHLWGDGSTTPSIEPTTIGTQEYTIQVTDGMGCLAMDTVNLTLINQVGPTPFFEIDSVCPFSPHSLQDASTPAANDPILFYTWDLPTTSLNGNNQSYQSPAAEPYGVLLTISTQNGCESSYSDTAYFFEQPEVSISASGNCENQMIEFAGGQSSSNTILNWVWNFDDPASGGNNAANGANPAHVYQSFGDYNVELIGTDENNCEDTVTQTILIHPLPEVDFNFLEVCFGNPVFFNNASTIDGTTGSSIENYNWDFGDATNSGQTNPSKIYNSSGTYPVTLFAESSEGCIDTLTQSVKIHNFPDVDQIVESNCAGIEFTLEDNSFVNDGSIGSVSWLVDQNTTLTGFTVSDVINQEGVVNVTQTVQSSFGCQSVDTFSFELLNYLNADFSYEPNVLIAGTPISFTSTSVGAESFEWTFESIGSSTLEDTTIVVPFDLMGDTLDIQLAIENAFSCRDSLVISLPVVEQEIDLSLDELFLQDSNDSYIVGVRLKNSGNTPIKKADLLLKDAGFSFIIETWEGMLLPGESEIYIFSNSLSSTFSEEDLQNSYVCVRGTVIEPNDIAEIDLSNNEICKLIAPAEQVLLSPYPNPIGDQYTVKIILASSDVATLKVIDAQGKEVDVIFENEPMEAGLSLVEVDASLYANGAYFLRYVGERKIEQVRIIKQ